MTKMEKRIDKYENWEREFDRFCDDNPDDVRCSAATRDLIKNEARSKLLKLPSASSVGGSVRRFFTTNVFLGMSVGGFIFTFLLGLVGYDFSWQDGLRFVFFSWLLILLGIVHILPLPGLGIWLLASSVRTTWYNWALAVVGLESSLVAGFWYMLWMIIATTVGTLLGVVIVGLLVKAAIDK